MLHFCWFQGILCFVCHLYTTNEKKKLSASFIFLNKARGWAKEKNSFWLEMGYTSALHRLLFNWAVWRRWFNFDVKRLVYFLLPNKQMKSECPLSLAKAFYLSSFSRLSLWFFFLHSTLNYINLPLLQSVLIASHSAAFSHTHTQPTAAFPLVHNDDIAITTPC